MTPVLVGRWQTRILLTFLVGLPLGIIFDVVSMVVMILILGLVLDIFYDYLQHRRLEADWPPVLILLSGIIEGMLLWIVTRPVSYIKLTEFVLKYGIIFLLMFIFQLGILNIFFPERRFKGGKIL